MCLNFFKAPVGEIDVTETRRLHNSKQIVLLDVRTREEHYGNQYGRIDDSLLIPLQRLLYDKGKLEKYKDREIIIYCRSGQRSAEACRILDKDGFKTKNMLGGIIEWKKLGYKTIV